MDPSPPSPRTSPPPQVGASGAPRPRDRSGFTLTELIVVLAIALLAATVGLPTITKRLHRGKIETFSRATAALIQMGRLEALKREAPAVVQLDVGGRRLLAFIDLDEDGVFFPDPISAPRTTDYLIGTPLPLPADLFPRSPSGSDPLGAQALEGFTAHPDEGRPNHLAFDAAGRLRDEGAFRFGDASGNYLEIRVRGSAAVEVELRKWNDPQQQWRSAREGWTWH